MYTTLEWSNNKNIVDKNNNILQGKNIFAEFLRELNNLVY